MFLLKGHQRRSAIRATWIIVAAITIVLVVALLRCSLMQAPVKPPCVIAGQAKAVKMILACDGWTPLARVEKGSCHRVQAFGCWKDADEGPCTADGMDPGPLSAFHGLLIAPYAPWFSLIGKVGAEGDPFFIGDDAIWAAPATDTVYVRVNDVPGFYWNNSGALAVLIRPHPSASMP